MYWKIITAIGAAALLAACASTSGPEARQQAGELATQAANVLRTQMQRPPNKRIPKALLSSARCIGVFPSVTQAAFIIGGKHGNGVIACRNDGSASWRSASPAIYSLSGGSIGFQAGVQNSKVILLFLTRQSVNDLMQKELKFGAGVDVAAGPVGWNASVNSNPAPVISYQSSQGLFAGVNLNGSTMSFQSDANSHVYGQAINGPREVLFQMNQVPNSLDAYNQALAQYVPD